MNSPNRFLVCVLESLISTYSGTIFQLLFHFVNSFQNFNDGGEFMLPYSPIHFKTIAVPARLCL